MTGEIPMLDFTVPQDQQTLMYTEGAESAYANEEGYANEDANEMFESPPPPVQMSYERQSGLEPVPGRMIQYSLMSLTIVTINRIYVLDIQIHLLYEKLIEIFMLLHIFFI